MEKQTLETFVAGGEIERAYLKVCNHFATNAEWPLRTLVICGPRGTGKTHLLRGMVAAAEEAGVPANYLSAGELVHLLEEGVRKECMPEALRECRMAKILCLDGLHDFKVPLSLQSRAKEFLGGERDRFPRLAWASTVPVRELISQAHDVEMPHVPQPLVKELARNVELALNPPALAARRAIAAAHARECGIVLTTDAYTLLARCSHETRELIRIVATLALAYSRMEEPITVKNVRKVFPGMQHTPVVPTIAQIMKEACRYFSLPYPLNQDAKRPKGMAARASHIAMYLARRYIRNGNDEVPISILSIAEAFGRDHSTVSVGIAKVHRLLESGDPHTARAVRVISEALGFEE